MVIYLKNVAVKRGTDGSPATDPEGKAIPTTLVTRLMSEDHHWLPGEVKQFLEPQRGSFFKGQNPRDLESVGPEQWASWLETEGELKKIQATESLDQVRRAEKAVEVKKAEARKGKK